MTKINRRQFVQTTGAAAAAAVPTAVFGQAPTMMTPKSVKPCVVASSNGNRSKDEQGVTCVAKAFKMMTEGADVLDALVAGVGIVELDPNQTGVGWSGLPNAEGVVQLDASCMHGPKKRAGAVAAIEGVRAPARVAQLVADETDHHLLVGKGAQDFARAMGVKIEEGLINETARKQWLEWKRRTDPLHYLSPKERAQAWYDARGRFQAAPAIRRFWAPGSTSTVRSAPPDRLAGANRICTTCHRSSSSRRCGAARTRRTRR
ncbi:MAG: isoaspartyl peptidase/L-asparaginase [Acidobacteria bacterium]|nr:isoaspartyl peptidase/L-asparaginase [Acidobacteriota bacterium]